MAGLKGYVHVRDDRGENHVFGPGDEVPDWAAKLITNAKAWEDEPTASNPATAEPPAPKDKKAPKAGKSAAKAPTEPQADGAPAASGEPPRVGAGSGTEAWSDYAASLKLTVPEDAKRADIIQLVDDAKAANPALGSDAAGTPGSVTGSQGS
jgi:hypothetical protein